MASLNVNLSESTASNDGSTDVIHENIADIKKFDIIVLKEHIVEVIEITRSLSKIRQKYHVLGKDIFTNHRYEDILKTEHMVQVIPHLSKKDYLLVSIEDDGFITLINEETYDMRSDLKLNKNSELDRQVLDKYNEGNGQIKVTVLKALNEERIIEYKIEDE